MRHWTKEEKDLVCFAWQLIACVARWTKLLNLSTYLMRDVVFYQINNIHYYTTRCRTCTVVQSGVRSLFRLVVVVVQVCHEGSVKQRPHCRLNFMNMCRGDNSLIAMGATQTFIHHENFRTQIFCFDFRGNIMYCSRDHSIAALKIFCAHHTFANHSYCTVIYLYANISNQNPIFTIQL